MSRSEAIANMTKKIRRAACARCAAERKKDVTDCWWRGAPRTGREWPRVPARPRRAIPRCRRDRWPSEWCREVWSQQPIVPAGRRTWVERVLCCELMAEAHLLGRRVPWLAAGLGVG
eukprot:2034912-Pleurochrysis_carterae.AAC.1